ncbi:hypothetical protein D9Q98_001995 [Chlorella vulgaris]|uniref:Carbohydrate kinase PfkB domain-containing protein n=1 Tax=Chlorella vulgaris TaxID=3077 RepID=A0A9D4TWS6_CHLVU|nr:hypothetical protein D9Q98_001995 [Chlorella vulgaris]
MQLTAAGQHSDFQGCNEPLPQAVKVVGMGSSCQDLLAQVATFPCPDAKLRTEAFEAQGGGNCGNALTAAARLGLHATIVSKIGDDGVGDGILAEFQRDAVDTSHMLRAEGSPSPFTYIVVDREGGTRTCIHTPGQPMTPEELTAELAGSALRDAALVYFDGRLTEAALVLAAAARQRGVPVLVEAERLRPGLEQLLGMADFVVSSTHFPQEWTGEELLGDALVATFGRLPHIRWLITTLGSRGSVLLERGGDEESAGAAVLDDLLPLLTREAGAAAAAAAIPGAPQPPPACVSANGTAIYQGGSASSERVLSLRLQRSAAEAPRVLQAALVAAETAAAANADIGNAAGYASAGVSPSEGSEAAPGLEVQARVTVVQAALLPAGAVVDTTGAGDSFIGSIVYGEATGMPVRRAMQLASVVAACKCTASGARQGLPHRSNLAPSLLQH